ncbi:hypothetical protein BGZ93_006607 [Podila epicladia]|nr:hypothetical protein BGZ92_009397 [Podila epicladia]KAG0100722.1 hypothetical protein BGZ93_006607 [Podila epicladia]
MSPFICSSLQFKAGMKLILQAYEDRYQSLTDEANKWKWISEEQSVQMAAMAAELARVEESLSTLQKEMSQLETFRKAIVSMVDQHSGVSLTQLEQSILETIEADAEHVDAGYDVADADTSSFILDGEVESSFSPHQQKHEKEPLGSRSLRSAPVSTGTSRPRAATGAERSSTTAKTEITSTLTSGQSPNGLKKLHRFGSSDSLRSKRNTISSSTRPFYPSTSSAHNGTSKRHSSISPLSPKVRMTSAKAVASSFSTNSTPSTSPREQATQPSAPSSRTTRHQQKEYSIGIRSTMSHLASLSVSSMVPTSSRRNVSSDAISAHIVASSPGSSDSAKRSRRSGSATMSMANLSPAAMELLKQQERLQEQERGALKGTMAIIPHSSRPVQAVGEDEKRSSVQGSTTSGFVHVDETSQGSRRGSSARHSKDERRYVSQSDSEKTKGDPGSFNDIRRQQSTGGSSGVDASAFTLLYKEIRDSMDATSFGLFARVVTAFNEGEKTTNETLQEVSKIVKDRALNQRFKNLIEQAIAEKESQLDEAGNETIDGDVTLEIDNSLLMDVEEGDEELIDEDDQYENFGSIHDPTGMGIADLNELSSRSVGDDDYIDEHSQRYGDQEKQNTTPGGEIGEDALEATRTVTTS